MSLQNDLRHLPITRIKTCFWQVIHNIVMDLDIPISETSVELINGVFGWGAVIFGKSAKHELTFNRWRLKRTWMTIFTKFHPSWENKDKFSEDKAGLEFTRTLLCSDWWWFIGEGLPEQESVTASGYIIAPCTMHYLVPGQKDRQTDKKTDR